jgi:hypothetical protein
MMCALAEKMGRLADDLHFVADGRGARQNIRRYEAGPSLSNGRVAAMGWGPVNELGVRLDSGIQCEGTLRKSVESVLGQKMDGSQQFELIIVVDVSSDSTAWRRRIAGGPRPGAHPHLTSEKLRPGGRAQRGNPRRKRDYVAFWTQTTVAPWKTWNAA